MLEEVKTKIESNSDSLIEEVRKILKIPSISATGEGIEETASYIKDWLRENLGVQAILLRYVGNPIVYGKLDVGAEKTIVLYNMYDVQPVEPLEEWICHPFEAKIVDDKIVARGSYNTKGALMSSLFGLKFLEDPPVNLIFVFEGEEEIGSVSMPKFIEDKRDEIRRADLVYFPFPSERVVGKPTIVLGYKGIVFVEIKAKVSSSDVHSSLSRGFYNPAAILAKIASELIDPLEGPKIEWLDEKAVINKEDLEYVRDIMEAIPKEETMMLHGIRKSRTEGLNWYIDVYFKPTVNIDGFSSGYTGPGTKTIIPSEATMRLDFRIVPGIKPEDVINGLTNVCEKIGLKEFVEMKVHDVYTWSRTDPKDLMVEKAKKAYEILKMRPYIVPMSPGSAPLYLFTELGLPAISTAPGHGGRAHAPNEYIKVDSLPKIALYTAALMLVIGSVATPRERI